MTILVCGSLAFDFIMVYPDQFRKHILPDQIHILNVTFMVPEMRREYGGTGGNIAYNLKLLGEDPAVMATVGHDFGVYAERMDSMGLSRAHVRVIEDQYTAQAFITTDVDDNQITAFHPGAMSYSHQNKVADVPGATLAITAPDGYHGMLEHARDLAAAGIPYVFDPGQGLPMYSREDLLTLLEDATALTVNDYEMRLVEQKVGQSCEEIAARIGAVLVTRGGEGCSVYTTGRREDIPPVRADAIVDPTGCGDAFRAGLLYGMARGWTWARAARLGCLMGSIKIAHKGGQNHRPTREEIAWRLKAAYGEEL